MANEPVGASRHQTAQGRADSEQSAQSEKTDEAQTRRERHQDEPGRRPRWIAGHPAKINDLRVGVDIRYENGGARG